jgi:hypothetical protein
MSTIKTMFWAAPLTTLLPKKANIDPAVRAKLEELGIDTVRSKLVWIMNVRDLAEQDATGGRFVSFASANAGLAYRKGGTRNIVG